MKQTLQLIIAVASIFLVSCASSPADLGFSGTSESLQHDLDISRLEDLKVLSGHIEKYRELTGKYPFEGAVNIPNYTLIATREQQKYAVGGPDYNHRKTPAIDFVTELQDKLGDIEVPFDLQRVPVNKPNFYIYSIVDDVYFLAVHVHNDFSFANKISDHYYKVEVTNRNSGNRPGTWFRSELLSHPEYNAALIKNIWSLKNANIYDDGDGYKSSHRKGRQYAVAYLC